MQVLLFAAGEGGTDAQSEGGGGSGAGPATSAELAALKDEVHELRRLLLAVLERLPSSSGGSAAGGGAIAAGVANQSG